MDHDISGRDHEAQLAFIYRAYAPAVLAYARRRCDPDDAADVVAETFVVAWRRIRDVPAEPKTKPWLFGVARRVLANQRRGSNRRGELVRKVSHHLVPQLRNVMSAEPEGDARIVGDALKGLSLPDQDLLMMVAWEELTPAEIAVVLGVPGPVVRKRLFRARKRLAHAMAESEIETGPLQPESLRSHDQTEINWERSADSGHVTGNYQDFTHRKSNLNGDLRMGRGVKA